jgi:ferredoxin
MRKRCTLCRVSIIEADRYWCSACREQVIQGAEHPDTAKRVNRIFDLAEGERE